MPCFNERSSAVLGTDRRYTAVLRTDRRYTVVLRTDRGSTVVLRRDRESTVVLRTERRSMANKLSRNHCFSLPLHTKALKKKLIMQSPLFALPPYSVCQTGGQLISPRAKITGCGYVVLQLNHVLAFCYRDKT